MTLRNFLGAWARKLIAIFIIPVCSLCGSQRRRQMPLEAQSGMCAPCRLEFKNELVFGGLKLSLEGSRFVSSSGALGEYAGQLKQAVLALKRGAAPPLPEFAGVLLGNMVRGWSESIDLVVWAPASPARRRRLGVDHGARLARAVSRQLNIQAAPVFKRIEQRAAGGQNRGRAQHDLSAAERRALKAAISVKRSSRCLLRNRHILLIDDVYTTGATALSCAELLVASGAKSVSYAALAATPLRLQPGRC